MSAQDILLSPEEHAELSRRTRSATIRQRDVRRARVILLAAQGCSRVEIARLVGFSLARVTLWCQRFQERGLDGLIDKPGRGRKVILAARSLGRVLEQVVQPRIDQSRWSCRSMAQVNGYFSSRIWAANDIKPHLARTFKLSNDPNFEEKFWDVIGLYLDTPDKALVLCCDEKSQVQALERTQLGLPLGIGHIRTQSHDYIRHGTVTLFTALDYLEGRLISSIERQHRHQEWLDFLKKINRETPKHLQLHLIVDNYATHKHPKVKGWLEKHKVPYALSHDRFTFHLTPTSCSCLNAVEGFFASLSNRRLNRGVFHSVVDLQAAIKRFLVEQKKKPKPFTWTADPDNIIAAVKRGDEALESIQ
uniref:IS870-like transposase n=2 Tax=Pseudomonas syringae group TaxID=136849 RepID=Q9RBZ2_PSESG|nr:IS870-like transposase [Pseudomonas savastanoi pv. glycinea]